jgi:hypothetical protein
MLNSASSVPVFSETHYTPTDDLGQVNIVIGQGTATASHLPQHRTLFLEKFHKFHFSAVLLGVKPTCHVPS